MTEYVVGWHEWFAWHPVALDSGGIAWLRRVERIRAKVLDPYGCHWLRPRHVEVWRYR